MDLQKNISPIITDKVVEDTNEEGDKKINQYTLLSTIGNGAFSKVKKVMTKEDDKTKYYAAKVVKKHVLIRQRAVRYNSKGEPVMLNNLDKIYEEINVWKDLDDNRLVKLHEIIDDENSNKMYLIMELADKGQIMKYDEESITYLRDQTIFKYVIDVISKTKDISNIKDQEKVELVAKWIFKEVVEAIYYLHSNNIVHRDIKPDNILVSTTDGLSIKLADFTVAVSLSSNDQICYDYEGTPFFTSPEVSFCLNEGYSPKPNDIWSLGVCIYTYVFEKMPFTGDSDLEVQIATKDKDFEIEDWISDPLKTLLKNLMDKDPSKRMKIEEIREFEWFKI